MVVDGDANMTIGTYALSLERVSVMSYSKSYSENKFILAYKESSQLATPLARLMSPFESYVWISIAFLLMISILVILLTKKLPLRQRHFIIGGKLNRTPILNMINTLIGNAVSNPRMTQRQYFSIFARTLCILWLFFWVVVRNSYVGSLYGTLQNQQVASPYDTVEKVRMSKAKIYITGTATNLLEGFDDKRWIFHGFFFFFDIQLKKMKFSMKIRIHFFSFKTDSLSVTSILTTLWPGCPKLNGAVWFSRMIFLSTISIWCTKRHRV